MDVSLWREFGRLGVCERGELVTRMRTLLGTGVTQETAAFFLDMTDWDLQAAVCCYLDTYAQPQSSQSQALQALPAPQPMQSSQSLMLLAQPSPPSQPSQCPRELLLEMSLQPDFSPSGSLPSVPVPSLLSMRLAEEDCNNREVRVQPNVPLKWSWRVMNNGENSWPEGCLVVPFIIHRSQTLFIETKPLGPVDPGEIETVEANLITPSELGNISQVYYLCTPDGLAFGELLKIMLVVENNVQISLECPSDMSTDHNMC